MNQRNQYEAPSWLISLGIHAALLLTMALTILPLTPIAPLFLEAHVSEIEDLELEPLELDMGVTLEKASLDHVLEPSIESSESMSGTSIEANLESLQSPFESASLNSLSSVRELVAQSASLGSLDGLSRGAGLDGSGLQGRTGAMRAQLLKRGGGTRQSEKAVDAGLDWIARHQMPDGTWNFEHRYGNCNGRCNDPGNMERARGAATGLALLCFLGAGQTHEVGAYRQTVRDGLAALVGLMKPDDVGLGFWDPQGRMYSHGIATMALCEAYAMTGDSRLHDPAQAAVHYICAAQDPRGGGWRYSPGDPGDTSVMGWQVAALKSGHLSQLQVTPAVVVGAGAYLNSVQVDEGEAYVYSFQDRRKGTSLTAIGVLCRMYMGADRQDPRVLAGVGTVSAAGPSAEDCYHNYYAAQALFHFTDGEGEMWRNWNESLREMLIKSQKTDGHEKGSWTPFPQGDHGTRGGGRLYATALSTMTLEVYYRMMPMYRKQAVDEKFDVDEK